MKKAWIYLAFLLAIPISIFATDIIGVDSQFCFNNGYCYTVVTNDVYFNSLIDNGVTLEFTGLDNTTVYDATNNILLSYDDENATIYAPSSDASIHFFSETALLDNCTSGNKVMSLTYYGETNRTDTEDNTTVEVTYWSADNSNANFSFKLENNSTYDICLYPAYASYTMDMDLTYYKNGFAYRNWFFDNISLSNVTQNVSMYMVTATESSGTTIHVQDIGGSDVTGAIIQVQRYYMDIGQYITVTMGRTDDNGDAYINLVPYDVWYRFIIVKDGVVLDTIEPMQIKSSSLVFTVEEDSLMEFFQYWDKIAYSCSENQVTNYFSCTVTDTSGLMHQVCLRVEEVGAITNTVLCDNCSAYSTGITMGCSGVNSTENTYFYELYSVMDEYYVIDSDFLEQTIGSLVYEEDGLILSGLVIGTLAGIGLFNPVVAIAIALTGLGVSIYMGFVVLKIGTFISIVIVGLIIIFKQRS